MIASTCECPKCGGLPLDPRVVSLKPGADSEPGWAFENDVNVPDDGALACSDCEHRWHPDLVQTEQGIATLEVMASMLMSQARQTREDRLRNLAALRAECAIARQSLDEALDTDPPEPEEYIY